MIPMSRKVPSDSAAASKKLFGGPFIRRDRIVVERFINVASRKASNVIFSRLVYSKLGVDTGTDPLPS
jgi:hypothetical protein